MTPLENLLKDSGLSKYAFAKAVGITPQRLHYQLGMKSNLFQAYKYAEILGISKIHGIVYNQSVDIEVCKNEL